MTIMPKYGELAIIRTGPQHLTCGDEQLEPFYTKLLSLSFTDSATAIKHCRTLCAEYGFTVKQEASTHRNIYVYCSREGLPDSLRNPKANPQRKRPSKRCDCRWRVVLYERKGVWLFRKSLNPEAAKHNHELMKPEEIERSWPKEVMDYICELANERLATQEIRNRVKTRFEDITWNERRFYNRLSDERQKIKYREAYRRAMHLTGLCSKLSILTAGNEELFQHVDNEITKLLDVIGQAANVDVNTIELPSTLLSSLQDTNENINSSQPTDAQSNVNVDPINFPENNLPGVRKIAPKNKPSTSTTTTSLSTINNSTATITNNNSNNSLGNKSIDPPKGYTTVDIPQHSYFVKIHNQRISVCFQSINPEISSSTSTKVPNTTQLESSTTADNVTNSNHDYHSLNRPSRRRQTSLDDGVDTQLKKSRKGKEKEKLIPASQSSTFHMNETIPSPIHDNNNSNSNEDNNNNNSIHGHSGLPSLSSETTLNPSGNTTTFIYHTQFGNQGLSYDNTLPYVPYQQSYNSPSNPSFSSQMTFQFDPLSSTPPGREPDANVASRRGDNRNIKSKEPTIHPALTSDPMDHDEHDQQDSQHHQHQQHLSHHSHHHHHHSSTETSGMPIDSSLSEQNDIYPPPLSHSDHVELNRNHNG
ncbi:unnamed protein product [Cunninghamella echinulata]